MLKADNLGTTTSGNSRSRLAPPVQLFKPIGSDLLRGWLIVGAACIITLGAGFQLAARVWNGRGAWLWALAAGSVLAYILYLLWKALAPYTNQALPYQGQTWGVANILTLTRGILLGLLSGFLLLPRPDGWGAWLPAGLYTASIALDYLDGLVARRTDTVTHLGETLDKQFDALGILIAILLTIRYRNLPPLFLIVGLAHYLFSLGLMLRLRQGKRVHPLPPSALRRRWAGFQMGLLSVLLWPIANQTIATLLETLLAIPLLTGFCLDYLMVTGRLDHTFVLDRWLNRRLSRLLSYYSLLLLRLFTGIMGIGLAIQQGFPQGLATPWAAVPGLAWTDLLLLGDLSLSWIAPLLVALGVWGAGPVLVLLLTTGLRLFLQGLDPGRVLLLSAAFLLLLWKRDEAR